MGNRAEFTPIGFAQNLGEKHEKMQKYKREYFEHGDERLRSCDDIVGILKWCNKHKKEIIQIIKTKGYLHIYSDEYNYELIYREK